MLNRLKSAIPLILIVTLAFLLPGWWGGIFFLLLAAGMLFGGFHEAYDMAFPQEREKNRVDEIVATTCGLLIASKDIFDLKQEVDVLAIALYLLILCGITFRRQLTAHEINRFFCMMGLFFYLGWTLSFLVRLYFNSRPHLIFLIAVGKMADVGAYAIGVLSSKRAGGNHKIAPLLSPKKSWEGLVGGVLFAILTACAMKSVVGLGWWHCVFLGVVSGVCGLMGDLIESALKRVADKKDSGRLPGIGGVLDVLDSLIPLSPLFFFFYTIFQ